MEATIGATREHEEANPSPIISEGYRDAETNAEISEKCEDAGSDILEEHEDASSEISEECEYVGSEIFGECEYAEPTSETIEEREDAETGFNIDEGYEDAESSTEISEGREGDECEDSECEDSECEDSECEDSECEDSECEDGEGEDCEVSLEYASSSVEAFPDFEDPQRSMILSIIKSFGEETSEYRESKYDRVVDIIATAERQTPHISLDFLDARIAKSEGAAHSPIFECLPSYIRLQIWGNLFSVAFGKKINLSKDFVTKDVFPDDYFISPWDLIETIQGAISSCRQMRQEILWYFCHEFHFHVTFSPFTTGPSFSGLSVKWLNLYAKWINHLTLEVDFTRLAFSKDAYAIALSLFESAANVLALINDLVQALMQRDNAEDGAPSNLGQRGNDAEDYPSLSLNRQAKVRIANLHLMIRRFQGVRDTAKEPRPYCPDAAFLVFNPFFALRECVDNCRMSGFSHEYTATFINNFFEDPILSTPAKNDLAWPNYEPPPPAERVFLSEMTLAYSTSEQYSDNNYSEDEGSETAQSTLESSSTISITYSDGSSTQSMGVGLGISISFTCQDDDSSSGNASLASSEMFCAEDAFDYESLASPSVALPPILGPSPITRLESPDLINDLNERNLAYISAFATLRPHRASTV